MSAQDAGRLGEWIGSRVNVQDWGGQTLPGTLVSVGATLTIEWEGKKTSINWDHVRQVWVKVGGDEEKTK